MARRIAALTVSGASKLTSPWSRRNGSLTEYIMSRMRMMPENGTVSRNAPMGRMLAVTAGRRPPTANQLHELQYPGEGVGGAADRQVADVEVPDAPGGELPDGARAHLVGGRAGRELLAQLLDGDGQEFPQRLERLPVRRPVVEHAEHAGQGQPAPIAFREKPLDRR